MCLNFIKTLMLMLTIIYEVFYLVFLWNYSLNISIEKSLAPATTINNNFLYPMNSVICEIDEYSNLISSFFNDLRLSNCSNLFIKHAELLVFEVFRKNHGKMRNHLLEIAWIKSAYPHSSIIL